MRLRSLNRYQASAWHFSLSALLGLAVFMLFRFVWYPGALWDLSGAAKLLLLVVGVDVTLGPLLTLIVFNPKKKSLPFDLAVIALVQSAALAYGVWVMAQSRPVYLVGAVDRFVLVAANDLDEQELAAASEQYRALSWTGPRLVATCAHLDREAKVDALFSAIETGIDVDKRPKFYCELDAAKETLLKRTMRFDAVLSKHPDRKRALAEALGTRYAQPETLLLPLQSRAGFGSAVVDGASARPILTTAVDIFED